MNTAYSVRDVLVDIDGTVALIDHRRKWVAQKPKNWKKFFEDMDKDLPNGPVIHLVNTLKTAGNQIIFCSGRNHSHRHVTRQWLGDNVGEWTWDVPLFMRKDGDSRSDDIIKEELLMEIRLAGYNPTLSLDDRDRVVAMWRRNGITCCQVAEGNF